MSKKRKNEMAHEEDTFVFKRKKKKKGNILPFILCLLIAFVIWLYASYAEEQKEQEENQGNHAVTAAEVVPVGEWSVL